MPRGRAAGTKNRNYPALPLAEAVRVAKAIQDEAGGMKVSGLTLAELLDTTPTSRRFRELVGAARLYGLTEGGINAPEFGLTELGRRAAGADEVEQIAALKEAVLNVPPYRTFFQAFRDKKMPGPTPQREFLVRDAGIDAERVEEARSFLVLDAQTAGFVRSVKGSDYLDLSGTPAPPTDGAGEEKALGETARAPAATVEQDEEARGGNGGTPAGATSRPERPTKVFIAHGKNRTPLEQLKKALDQFKVPYAVAVDEPNKGRPISKKVAELMRNECSSGIFIFTADEHFLRRTEGGETEDVWRPSENVVFELGAASILYENRIVIFKEHGVSFPTDFSDLGYIEFAKDQLVAEIGNLFQELVALDILEVRAKG